MKKLFTLLIMSMLAMVWHQAQAYNIYILNNTGWEKTALYTYSPEIYGGWPGSQATVTKVGNYNYEKYSVPNEHENASPKLIYNNNNNGKQLPDVQVTLNKDHYFVAWEAGMVEIDDSANPPTEAVIEKVNIYINNQSSWPATGIYLYAYSGGNQPFGVWPGKLRNEEVTIDGVSYNRYEIDKSSTEFTYILNNNGSGKIEESDMTFTADKDFYICMGDNSVIKTSTSPFSPEDVTEPEQSDSDSYTYTVYYTPSSSTVSTVTIWWWDDKCTNSKDIFDTSWDYKPSMEKKQDANGNTYFVKTATLKRELKNPQIIFVENGNQTDNLTFINNAVFNHDGNYSTNFDPENPHYPGDPEDPEETHDPAEWLVNGIPVIYIDVYNESVFDANSNFNAENATFDNEIININLDHKNYFSNAAYRIDPNGSEFSALGSIDSPLPLEIKARGNYTRTGFAKKPFKLKLGKKQNLLGLSANKSKHYALLAHADDECGFLRNFIGFELGKNIGLPWTPNQTPVQVVINGDYRGLYFLTESIRVEKGRIDITELDDNADNPTDLTGGYLVELDNYTDDPNTIIIDQEGPVYVTPDTPEVYSNTQKRFITEQFHTMNNLIKNKDSEIWEYIQLDDAARYYIVEEIIGHWEAYHGSTYLYRDKATADDNGKWHFSPLWDCGHAFGTEYNKPFTSAAAYGNTWIDDMRNTPDFMDKVKETWKWFMQNKYGDIIKKAEDHSDLIRNAAAKDNLRWDGIKPSTSNASFVVNNTDIDSKTSNVVDYLNNRLQWLTGEWGNYNDGEVHSEPARDNRKSAELPYYIQPGFDPPTYNVYYYTTSTTEPRVWIWTTTANYTGGDWNNRPTMEPVLTREGLTVYKYSFKTEDDLSHAMVKFDNNENNDFTNNALYSSTGVLKSDFDPDAPSDYKPSDTLPVLHINVYDESNELTNELVDINLDHKNYFSNANYWLEVPDGDSFEAVGSAESPLPLEIKARGNNTRISYAKKPFKLKLGAKQSLLGLSKSKHFALIAHPDDEYGFMRNFVGFTLGQKMGLPWTPSQQPVEVVINGDYRGLYFLTESIRVEESRLNITELGDNMDNPADLTGGYLVELDNYTDDPNTIIIDRDVYVTPDTPEVYSDTQKRFITEQFTTMNDLIKAHNTDIWKYIQLDDAARYYIVEEIIGHWEAYHGSTYLYRDKATAADDGKWHFSPLWDCGHAFDTEYNKPFTSAATFGNTWIGDMLKTNDFLDKVKETWLWYMQNQYDGTISAIDAYANRISKAAVSDYNRWNDSTFIPKTVTSASGAASVPELSCNPENQDIYERANTVKNYLTKRLQWLTGEWGNYNDGEVHPEPARDNRKSAELPEYIKIGYETEVRHNLSTDPVYIYLYNKAGWDNVHIWLYDANDKQYNNAAWPGTILSYNAELYYNDYTGLYYLEVPDQFKNGYVIFSDSGQDDKRYPADQVPGMPLEDKSHLFVNGENNWIEIKEQGISPSGTIDRLIIVTEGGSDIKQGKESQATFIFKVIADDGNTETTSITGTIKGRGTSSWTDWNKKPYKIKLDKATKLLDMTKNKHWVLLPFASDQANGYITNPLGHYLARIIDGENQWHSDMKGIELSLNGKYLGLYFLAEAIRPADDRVAVIDYDKEGYSAEDDWIIEIDNEYTGGDAPHSWTCESGTTHYVVPAAPEIEDFSKIPDYDMMSIAQRHGQNLQTLIERAGDPTVNNPSAPDVVGYWDNTWMDEIDAQAAVNYYLIQELMDDANAYNTNLYLHHTTGSKWIFGPVWNFEAAFSSNGNKQKRIYENGHQTWVEMLYSNRHFRVLAINTLDELAGIVEPAAEGNKILPGSTLANINNFIDNFFEIYNDAIIADAKRWPAGSLAVSDIVMLAAGESDEPDIKAMAQGMKDKFDNSASYLLNEGRDSYGGTTGIEQIISNVIPEQAEYYNLQGIRVANPMKGHVYIVRRGTSVKKELVR